MRQLYICESDTVVYLWQIPTLLVSASSAGHLFRIVSVDYVVYMYTINNMYVHLNNMYIYCQ